MRVALTGGATGIGAEVARRLKFRGHEITAFDITEPPTHSDHWIKTDLSDPRSIAASIDAAGGPYDALINNAGLTPHAGTAERLLNVNFIGFRQFLTGMVNRLSPGAAIVNTAAQAGARWRTHINEVKALMALSSVEELPGFVAAHKLDTRRAFALSKEAVIAFTVAGTEALIAEDLRMNAVSPGAVSSGMLGAPLAGSVPRAGRPGRPGEVAEVIVFLASPESRWLKGMNIIVDGGANAMIVADQLGLRLEMQ